MQAATSTTVETRTWQPRVVRTANRDGLASQHGLDAVEDLMFRLATSPELDLLGAIVAEHLDTGGKRIRARLALAAAEALGVLREDAVPWAAAVELLHNATLVHDDLQDGDRVRRGRPTTWVRHGAAQAINAGDLLLMLPVLALDALDAPGDTCWRLARALTSSAARTARGQALELDLLKARKLDTASWDRAAIGKTAGLLALPVEGAALLASRSAAEARRLALPFERLGLLFQLQDDVLDLYGEKGRGRRGSDLYEGKVSALVVEHLARHPDQVEWLAALLAAPPASTPEAEVELATWRFREGGALQAVLDRIDAIVDEIRLTEALDDEPDLRALAMELARVALAPIRHVFDEHETQPTALAR